MANRQNMRTNQQMLGLYDRECKASTLYSHMVLAAGV